MLSVRTLNVTAMPTRLDNISLQSRSDDAQRLLAWNVSPTKRGGRENLAAKLRPKDGRADGLPAAMSRRCPAAFLLPAVAAPQLSLRVPQDPADDIGWSSGVLAVKLAELATWIGAASVNRVCAKAATKTIRPVNGAGEPVHEHSASRRNRIFTAAILSPPRVGRRRGGPGEPGPKSAAGNNRRGG